MYLLVNKKKAYIKLKFIDIDININIIVKKKKHTYCKQKQVWILKTLLSEGQNTTIIILL